MWDQTKKHSILEVISHHKCWGDFYAKSSTSKPMSSMNAQTKKQQYNTPIKSKATLKLLHGLKPN